MSTSSLRLVAAGAAVIVAILTGLFTGLVGGQRCETATVNTPGTNAPGPDGGKDQSPRTASLVPAGVAETCERQFSAPAAGIGFAGAALAGGLVLAVFLFLRRDRSGDATAPVRTAAGGNGRREQSEKERAALIQTAIYVRDRTTSKALADRLGWVLEEVGVSTLAPAGVRFDPAQHEAGGAMATRNPREVGTIAAVEVAGYVDRGVVLRAPVVTVYREEK